MMRHTFATMALFHFNPTWDPPRLGEWLGHTNIETTYREYGHLIDAPPPSGYKFTEAGKAVQARIARP